MSETRDPALGMWSVFEGNEHKANKETALPFRGNVNEPIKWPVALRVFYIRNGVMRSRTVEIGENLEVNVEDLEEANI